MKFNVVIKAIRGPFLVLTPACIFLGMSTAVANQENIDTLLLSLALLGALLAHISVNTLNEYLDFKSGLDFVTKKTPFSGGSGALPLNPDMANTVLGIGLASLVATCLIGVVMFLKQGIGILPIGLAGIISIVAYTSWINKHPWICLITPGIGFGLLMVTGTRFALTGEYSALPWIVALVPFFLVNNLLLLNQFPDIKADSSVGRNHLSIAYGTDFSAKVYGWFVIATVAVIGGSVGLKIFPATSLVALLPIPLALYSLMGAIKHGEDLGNYPHYLASNVAVTLLTPVLLGMSFIMA